MLHRGRASSLSLPVANPSPRVSKVLGTARRTTQLWIARDERRAFDVVERSDGTASEFDLAAIVLRDEFWSGQAVHDRDEPPCSAGRTATPLAKTRYGSCTLLHRDLPRSRRSTPAPRGSSTCIKTPPSRRRRPSRSLGSRSSSALYLASSSAGTLLICAQRMLFCLEASPHPTQVSGRSHGP